MEECNLHTIVRLPNSVFKPYASIGTNLLFFEKGAPTKDIWFYEHRVPEGQKAYSMTKPIRIEHLQPCIDWCILPARGVADHAGPDAVVNPQGLLTGSSGVGGLPTSSRAIGFPWDSDTRLS